MLTFHVILALLSLWAAVLCAVLDLLALAAINLTIALVNTAVVGWWWLWD